MAIPERGRGFALLVRTQARALDADRQCVQQHPVGRLGRQFDGRGQVVDDLDLHRAAPLLALLAGAIQRQAATLTVENEFDDVAILGLDLLDQHVLLLATFEEILSQIVEIGSRQRGDRARVLPQGVFEDEFVESHDASHTGVLSS